MITFPPSDPPAEAYTNYLAQPPVGVLRWWVPGYPIMIGGNIQDAADLAHLQKDFGITHVLDVESGRGATCEHPAGKYKKLEFIDNGMPVSAALLREACEFARDAVKAGGKLLIHCHMGASRSPAIAYAILRTVYGLSHEDGLVAINRGFPHGEGYEWSYHQCQQAYVGAVDCFVDHGGIGA